MLHRAWWFGLLLSLLRTREECLCFLAAVWHLGQHQQEETGVYVHMVTSSLYSSSRFTYVRQFSSHLYKYIHMSCMCTCCYRNDLIQVQHLYTSSQHLCYSLVDTGQQCLVHLPLTVGINCKGAKAYSYCQLKCELQITAIYRVVQCALLGLCCSYL